MSWKAVEMQVVLPRIQDASRIQEQLQQRGQFMQNVLANQQLAQDEVKRKTVNDLNQKANLSNSEERKHKSTSENSQDNANKMEFVQQAITHPFLGKRIDING
ncbi:hypothetical protein GCM10011351_04330 [Paraliobacillus quinghaiensis]|uniref:Uncharacterized protein n=1 Tax=Paraliobacillus quinghaiensis TaxID=470815 RepID=A0A917TGC6_9BACI|nr:hypothetical protein [Paraliobacillus quinghaiensis]GGM21621.1 hypothetical protein GCM10011351_04330 [Paraliobacillus quinghaiensis]